VPGARTVIPNPSHITPITKRPTCRGVGVGVAEPEALWHSPYTISGVAKSDFV
jgi:hypothetical protein